METDERPPRRGVRLTPTPPFEALVFDLGGVIVSHDNAVLGERLLSRCAPGTGSAALRAIGEDDAFGTGAPIATLHRRLVDELGYSADWTTFQSDWCCHLVIDPSMLDFVEALARRNRVLIFSNTNAEHWDFLIRASKGRLAEFEAYLSHEIGRLKPSVDAFLHVARAAGLDPRRSIFFDDRADNVAGARAAGFEAEVFTSEIALRERLDRDGVTWDEDSALRA
ncbi:MAG TPA: HAD-IA family hydrolase [Caulobacteraceae bacterium]|jgi:FMN phosphatase YigB (HAD superfamily)|nr:HAD-IA family hydrolase [Caulobacteraceae bacterium]